MRDINIPQDTIQIKMRELVFSFTMNKDKKYFMHSAILNSSVKNRISFDLFSYTKTVHTNKVTIS